MRMPSQVLDQMFLEQELYIQELQAEIKKLKAKNNELLSLAIENGRERSNLLLKAALSGAFSPKESKG
jgi:cell shape-determining protein MreC